MAKLTMESAKPGLGKANCMQPHVIFCEHEQHIYPAELYHPYTHAHM